jgi:hypothetical protein
MFKTKNNLFLIFSKIKNFKKFSVTDTLSSLGKQRPKFQQSNKVNVNIKQKTKLNLNQLETDGIFKMKKK